jgi:hypothetical protein
VRTSQSDVRGWPVELSLQSAVKQRQRGRRPLNTEAKEPLPGNASEDCERVVLCYSETVIVNCGTCPINPITNLNPVYSQTYHVIVFSKAVCSFLEQCVYSEHRAKQP